MIHTKNEYVSVGGNRQPSAADWDARSGLLAYGADRNVALWQPLVFLNSCIAGCRPRTDYVDRVMIESVLALF